MDNSIILWFQTAGLKILLIIISGIIAQTIVARASKGLLTSALGKKMATSRSDVGQQKRADTLTQVITKTSSIIIFLIVLLMVFIELGINVTPILTGAGIIGIAVGFGAQDIVKNIFHGIFILMEDQYSEGDVITIAGITGTVENFDLRRTIIRDIEGVQHHVPNGEITVASNKTKGWSGINLKIGVGYNTNLSQLKRIIEQVGKDLEQQYDEIIKTPELMGIEEFADSAMIVKIVSKTKPGAQWDMSRKLRGMLKEAFDKEGIEIPFPHQVEIRKQA